MTDSAQGPGGHGSGLRVVATSHGRPAIRALHDWLVGAKAGDALAPATVLVPSNMVGLAVRRALASGDIGPISGTRAGLAGVDFLTAFRLAELLGSGAMAAQGRRPVSTAAIAAGVRRALSEGAPYFAAVAEHPTTERRLVAAHRELSDLEPAALDALAEQSPRASAVVDVHRRVLRVLGSEFHQEQDLVHAATDQLRLDPHGIGARLGPVALFLPEQLGGPRSAMLRELAKATSITIITALTGSPDADATPRDALESLGIDVGRLAPVARAAPPPLDVISVSDADDEVRHVVRGILAAAEAGTPFDKMAVLFASTNPYLRLLDDHLGAAGIPHNGAAVATLADSAAGRVLRRLLALPERDYRREDVIGLVGSTPLQWHGRPAPARAWDQISRDAGVVRGLPSWERRLAIHRTDLEEDLAAAGGDPDLEWRVRRLERSIALLDQLTDFVSGLATALERMMAASSWRARTRACRRLLADAMGERDDWPAAEALAADRLDLVLDRLAGLDLVEPDAAFSVFRRTLELELESGLGRSGAFGNGVLVGGASMAAALDLDRVWVVGMCEGSFPSRVRDDSLLPDRERRTTPGLRLRSDRTGDERRHLEAALRSVGDDGVATLTAPRGDLRQSNERAASRWLVEAAQQTLGTPISATSFGEVDAPWIDHVPSFAAGIITAPLPATRQELELQTLVVDTVEPVVEHPLIAASPALHRSAQAQRARDSRAFTRFDGNLAGLDIEAPGLNGRSVSATALETWARCPHQFFMRFLLGLEPLDTPEQRLQIDALTRGNVLHEIMERFVQSRIDGDAGLGDLADERDRLGSIAGRVFAAASTRGQTGEELYWRREQVLIRRLLDRWLLEDRARIRSGARPRAAELTFGLRGDEPVRIDLGAGGSVPLRGAIDRIDEGPDGELVVLDYKTGRSVEKVTPEDPHKKGTRLQLVLYALAAAERLGLAIDTAYSGYWYLQAPVDKAIRGYDTSSAVVSSVLAAVETIRGGVAAGAFPQHPDTSTRGGGYISCHYCDPDGLGVADAERRFQRKILDPALADYVALARPEALAPARLGFEEGSADE